MSSALQSLIQSFAGKGAPCTGSFVFPIVVTVAGFALHVAQTYFPNPTPNLKLVPFLPTPSFTPTPTPTRPLAPTRTTDFIDSRSAGAFYIWSGLVLVLIAILVGTGSTYTRTKSGTIFTPRDSSSREEEDAPREPPNIPPPDHPPSEEIQPSDDDDDDDSADDQHSSGDDNAGDSQDEEEDAESSEDDSASMNEGSPDGDPDDPSDSDSSNDDDDIPPARFEPDPWDVLMLILIYIFAATSIIRHALRKRSVLNALERRLGSSVVSIRTKASSFFERAFQWGYIDALQIMNDTDSVSFGTTTGPITLDDVKPTLIEGLLSPIPSRLSKVSSEVIIEALPLPAPEPSINPEPESFVVQPDSSTTETENESLRLVRAVSGWGTVILLIRRVVVSWRQRRAGTPEHQSNAEIEDEGSTAVENLGGSVISTEDGKDEENDAQQPSESFVTAEEPSTPNESQHVIPTIRILTSTPNTPESTTCPNTPSFAGVFTSSTLHHPNHAAGETEWTPAPGLSLSSFIEPTTPFTFTFTFSTPPRRTNTNTKKKPDADNDFMFTTPGRTPESSPSNEIKAYLSSRKRRRLDESVGFPIGSGTGTPPSFNGVFSSSLANEGSRITPNTVSVLSGFDTNADTDSPSFDGVFCSPAVQRNRRWLEETPDEVRVEEEESFDGVFCSPAVQRNRRWLEETKEMPDEERVEEKEEFGFKSEEIVEQVYEGEEDMDIEDEDHSVIYDFETLRALEQLTIARLTPKPSLASASTDSEDDQTVLDPEIIARGAAEMMRQLREDMERDRENAAKERRAEKARQRERESLGYAGYHR